MRTKSDHLVRGGALRGTLDTVFTPRMLSQLGRAIGTHARRCGLQRCHFRLMRGSQHELDALRTALISGLILSGHDVTDLGPKELLCTKALPTNAMPQLNLVIEQDEGCLYVEFGQGSLAPEALTEVSEIMDAGRFAAGTGTLFPPQSPLDNDVPSPAPQEPARHDTVVDV